MKLLNMLYYYLVSCDMTVSVGRHDSCKSGAPTPKRNWRGCWQLLAITVVACLLCCSGDVETNPGPGCKIVQLYIHVVATTSVLLL